MLFNEIYGSYFAAVSAIITEAMHGELTDRRMNEIIAEKCFGESLMNIPSALKNGDWPLLGEIEHEPGTPLTTLEKRWLKSVLLDRRAHLFGITAEGLEDIRPLFTPGVFDEYDRFNDGDPYDDEGYIARFQLLRKAVREKHRVRIAFTSSRGNGIVRDCIPMHIEFSAKDDKFRLIAAGMPFNSTINLSRMTSVELLDKYSPDEFCPGASQEEQLVFELTDSRNALERVLMHFSHLRKETERTGVDTYRVKMYYDRDDETEILIRILSFGPVIKAISPESFIEKLRVRLQKQLKLTKN